MNYNFDQIVDRRNTHSLKYDFALERKKPLDILPLWVADMDFPAPPQVLEAIQTAAAHGIFGYSEVKRDYFDAVHAWFLRRYGWDTREEWLVKTPGVVFALATAIRALTEEGDSVLIQQPVYYPFSEVIRTNRRKLVVNSLLYTDHRYSIDFEDFENKIVAEKVKLFLLCNPHNPVGRVWSPEELTRLGDICIKHGVTVISDEIHCDFTYPSFSHTVFANSKESFAQNSIICTAPSKTFNLAGLQVSNLFIKNEQLRRRIKTELAATGYSQCNTLGLIACKAAYQYGEPWLKELLAYLSGNLQFIREYLAQHLPQITLVEPQGTYLVWLDFSALGLSEAELEHRIVHRAKLWLDAGTMFGPEGKGFERINIACPRQILAQAMEQLKNAF